MTVLTCDGSCLQVSGNLPLLKQLSDRYMYLLKYMKKNVVRFFLKISFVVIKPNRIFP